MGLRILANENLPGEVVEALRREGHDVVWVRTYAPGRSDEAVLSQAQSEDRIVITYDKDFGELAFRWGLAASCGIVLFRMGRGGPTQAATFILAALRSRTDWAGQFAVVEAGRIRMRTLPLVKRKSS